MRLRRDSKPYKILKHLMIGGGLLVLSTISPFGGAKLVEDLVKLYFRKNRFEKEKFLRDLKNLQTRELVDYQELSNGEIKMVLTKNGKKLGLRHSLDNLKLDAQRKWDGRWRMIVFDIPDDKKQARDAFREKLKELRFYPIQESVFIVPYECENEIDFICSIFNIRDHVLIFYISSFEGEEKLKHYFGI